MLSILSEQEIVTAIDNINGIHSSDFKGQVVAYLMNEYMEFYDSQKKWDI